MMRILLIEDDILLAKSIQRSLSPLYNIDVVGNGEDGLYQATNSVYDLLILDLQLPGFDGMEICKAIRQKNKRLPILILTGKHDIATKIRAFNEGSDDYLTKPFVKEELLVRIKALIRRGAAHEITSQILIDDLCIDLESRTVVRQGKIIPLRRKEFAILVYLARHLDKVITRDMILSYIWGENVEPSGNTVDVHINYLRDKVDKPFEKALIHTVYGVGYKLST